MKVLVWHVHGSWTTSFVQGPDEYLVPVVPDRGPEGRGRAQTWDWPASAREVTPEELRGAEVDVVVLQRPEDLELAERWTGRRPGVDLPAVYVEHNTPAGHAAATVHPLADRSDIPVAHVTAFNRLMWDCGRAPTTVVDHGIVDPGHRWTGERARLGVVVNEPVRRWRVAGTDLLLDVASRLPVDVYGMGMAALDERAASHEPPADVVTHDDVPQDAMHDLLARDRVYLHPYRWTSLGLSLLEAMAIGMPVLALATTAAPEAVPPSAGMVTSDVDALVAAGRRWLHDPDEARARGLAAREHVLAHFGLDRFLDDWQTLLKEVTR
ncbi:glycosyltransferase family 4 protein [Actinotalea sp. AC32]|nr:glycosyltransferase family 4 protein [Actinotalea sp. AC32]